MMKIKGITDVKADRINEAAQKIEAGGFVSGLQIMEKRKKVKKLSTGSQVFDKLLGISHRQFYFIFTTFFPFFLIFI